MSLPDFRFPPKVEFTVSVSTFLKILAVLGGLWLLWYIRDILALFLVALILSSLIDPLADWLEVRRLPRAVAVLLVYIALFSILGLILSILLPLLIQEVRDLASNFSSIWDQLIEGAARVSQYSENSPAISTQLQQGLTSLQATLSRAIGGVFTTIVSLFGGVVSFVLTLVITFYLVLQEDGLRKVFYALVPTAYHQFAGGIIFKVERKIVAWIKGQLILSTIIAVFAYAGLSLIGVNYALVLGLFAGLVEFIPYAGPFIAAVVAVFFAFAQSWSKALMAIVLFIVIQQLENNIFVPKVMQRVVGLNPLVSILALTVGVKLAGFLGALFAIPVATALEVVVRELFAWQEESKRGKTAPAG